MTDPNPTETTTDDRRYLLGLFWDAALGFWRRGSSPVAWTLTITVVVLALVGLGIQYQLNVWYRAMFDALDQKNPDAVLRQKLLNQRSLQRTQWVFDGNGGDIAKGHSCLRSFRIYNQDIQPGSTTRIYNCKMGSGPSNRCARRAPQSFGSPDNNASTWRFSAPFSVQTL